MIPRSNPVFSRHSQVVVHAGFCCIIFLAPNLAHLMRAALTPAIANAAAAPLGMGLLQSLQPPSAAQSVHAPTSLARFAAGIVVGYVLRHHRAVLCNRFSAPAVTEDVEAAPLPDHPLAKKQGRVSNQSITIKASASTTSIDHDLVGSCCIYCWALPILLT